MRGSGMGVAIGLLVALAVWAPAAQAAAPANDNFADRELLSGALPIEATRSNVEATKEAGENLGGFQAGHSIWFEWRAPSSDWFTIGACDESFRHVVGVFTGTAVNTLTKVASGNRNEGPNCPFSERQFSFEAMAGADYEIAIDGNPFYVPPSPMPPTEGSTTLRIEETPDPPNDDFAEARQIVGSIEEEEPGQGGFYFANVLGYNWTADKEAGEPDHAGDPGGASVWYSWTAPVSGLARFSLCCGFETLLATMYTGNAVGALTPLASASGFGQLNVPVVGGSSYRIAVDGPQDISTGEAARAGFQLQVWMDVPPSLPVQPQDRLGVPAPLPDTVAPNTAIGKRKLGRHSAKFWFSADEAGAGFRCRLDRRTATACGSPKAFHGLAPGRHVFEVYAVDAAGNADPSPATARFAIARPRQKHK